MSTTPDTMPHVVICTTGAPTITKLPCISTEGSALAMLNLRTGKRWRKVWIKGRWRARRP